MEAVAGMVRPLVTIGLVAALIYMAIAQHDDNARGAAVNLVTAVVAFWFGTRQAEVVTNAAAKLAETTAAVQAGTGNGGPLPTPPPPPQG